MTTTKEEIQVAGCKAELRADAWVTVTDVRGQPHIIPVPLTVASDHMGVFLRMDVKPAVDRVNDLVARGFLK